MSGYKLEREDKNKTQAYGRSYGGYYNNSHKAPAYVPHQGLYIKTFNLTDPLKQTTDVYYKTSDREFYFGLYELSKEVGIEEQTIKELNVEKHWSRDYMPKLQKGSEVYLGKITDGNLDTMLEETFNTSNFMRFPEQEEAYLFNYFYGANKESNSIQFERNYPQNVPEKNLPKSEIKTEADWKEFKGKAYRNKEQMAKLIADHIFSTVGLLKFALDDAGFGKDDLAGLIIQNLSVTDLPFLTIEDRELLGDALDYWYVPDSDEGHIKNIEAIKGIDKQKELEEYGLTHLRMIEIVNELYYYLNSKEVVVKVEENVFRLLNEVTVSQYATQYLELLYFKAYKRKLWSDLLGEKHANVDTRHLILLLDTEQLTLVQEVSIDSYQYPSGELIVEKFPQGYIENKYIVENGDSIYAIANRFSVSIQDIAYKNGYTYENQKLTDNQTKKEVILYEKDEVILPKNLKVKEADRFTVIDHQTEGKAKVSHLEKKGTSDFYTLKDYTIVVNKINKLITSGAMTNHRLICSMIANFNNEAVALEILNTVYFSKFKAHLNMHWINNVMREFQRSLNPETIRAYSMRRQQTGIDPYDELRKRHASDIAEVFGEQNYSLEYALAYEKMRFIASIDMRGKDKLWEGLSYKQIADTVRGELQKAPDDANVPIDVHNIVVFLNGLKRDGNHIEEFYELYPKEQLLKDVEYARQKFRTRENIVVAYTSYGPVYSEVDINYLSNHDANDILFLLNEKIENRYLTNSEDVSKLYQTYNHQVNSDLSDRKFIYDEGTIIEFRKQKMDEPEHYYIVRNGDTPNKICETLGISSNELIKLNDWKSISKDGQITEKEGAQPKFLQPGNAIKITANAFDIQRRVHDSLYIVGNTVIKKYKDAGIIDAGTYRVNEDNYHPEFIHDLLNMILGQKGGSSLSFTLEIFVKGDIILVITLELGTEYNASLSLDDDTSITSKTSFAVKGEAGVAGLGNVKLAVQLSSSAIRYNNIDHYAVHFNNSVYSCLLDLDAQMTDSFKEYWDDGSHINYLRTNAYKVRKQNGSFGAGGGAKNKTGEGEGSVKLNFGFFSYDKLPTVDAPGQEIDITQADEGNKTSKIVSLDVVDAGLTSLGKKSGLSLVYSYYGNDVNSDNNGSYLTGELTLNAKQLKSLLYGGIKALKNSPSIEDLKGVWDKVVKPGSSHNFLKRLKSIIKSIPAKTSNAIMNEMVKSVSGEMKIGGHNAGISFTESDTEAKSLFEHIESLSENENKSSIGIGGDASVTFQVHFVKDGDSITDLKQQYTRVLLSGNLTFEATTGRISTLYGILGFEAGMKTELGYTRNVVESISPNTLTYASTVYNGMMSRQLKNYKEGENIMKRRDKSFALIERLKSNSLSDEDNTKLKGHEEDVKNYKSFRSDIIILKEENKKLKDKTDDVSLNAFKANNLKIKILKQNQDKILFNLMNTLHWDSVLGLEGKPIEVNLKENTWEEYSTAHKSELDQLAHNFYEDLWKEKDKIKWSEVNESNLMTITAVQAEKYFGKGGPNEFFMELLDRKELTGDMPTFTSQHLIIILKNLYKDQQSYDYTYKN
ncbi:LysM peptidoglycan-binding domain-containing protein [Flammeovirga aprica]|uniref:LysM peptidoglycan-binding domain-containing protein n=1 Tax=Flammeovirga aprica JL-4 TaxID=694437 RepID=A0A7X9RT25_9BACT|nr:LysM peptidoglycan-binding domain-containing protein [Flammeovirga aprica]NME66754.1 LysM peptidoglycan-binding domain-containing protein [Flammeovirga aprica JL-4]